MTSTASQQWIVHDHNELEGLQLQEVSIPKPGDYEVLLKIHAVSLNYRDVMIVTVKPHVSCRFRSVKLTG
jgi:NADPH:quinone reductase-like Zn-dependent oxidoreductase